MLTGTEDSVPGYITIQLEDGTILRNIYVQAPLHEFNIRSAVKSEVKYHIEERKREKNKKPHPLIGKTFALIV